MPITALGLSPAALGPVSGADPLVAAADAQAAEALAALAARARSAAADVAVEARSRQGLLDLDWHGAAASAFTDRVGAQVADLTRLCTRLDDVAAAAERASRGLR